VLQYRIVKCGLLKGILSFDCGFFETSKPSQYSSFMINDLQMLEEHYFSQIISITKHISMLIFACICILILNPVFLIIAVGIYLISIIVPAILKNKIVSLNKNVIEANTEFTKSCDEILVMDNGRLRTHGTYDDLVNSGQIPALLPLAI
jgi:ABC-type multidrug transport system, ATPase and permease components